MREASFSFADTKASCTQESQSQGQMSNLQKKKGQEMSAEEAFIRNGVPLPTTANGNNHR